MNLFDYEKPHFKFTHRPIRLFEAFSGYGSQAIALKRLGIEIDHIGISDIDKILSVVSNSQAYKLAGNSIVVNVLVEIFKKLF